MEMSQPEPHGHTHNVGAEIQTPNSTPGVPTCKLRSRGATVQRSRKLFCRDWSWSLRTHFYQLTFTFAKGPGAEGTRCAGSGRSYLLSRSSYVFATKQHIERVLLRQQALRGQIREGGPGPLEHHFLVPMARIDPFFCLFSPGLWVFVVIWALCTAMSILSHSVTLPLSGVARPVDGFLALHATHSSCTARAPSGTYWDGSACNSLTHWRLWGVCCHRGELGAEEAPGAVKAQGLCASHPHPPPRRVKVCGPQEENGPHTKACDQEGHFPFVLTLVRIWPQRGAWTRRIGESPAARPGEQQGQAAGPVCPTPGVAGAELQGQECAQCAQRACEGRAGGASQRPWCPANFRRCRRGGCVAEHWPHVPGKGPRLACSRKKPWPGAQPVPATASALDAALPPCLLCPPPAHTHPDSGLATAGSLTVVRISYLVPGEKGRNRR